MRQAAHCSVWVLCALALGCASPGDKAVLGPVATARVVEADLVFEARVDTGAEASSVHATGIEIVPATDDAGPRVRFVVENGSGQRATLVRPLADVAEVRGAGGTERRFRVPLTLAIGDVEAPVLVTLRDRSSMRHRLLVGRDVLEGRFVVDVDR